MRVLILSVLLGAWIAFLPLSTVQAESASAVVATSTVVRAETKPRRPSSPFAKGTLEAIELSRHQIKIKTEEGIRTFSYNPRTYMFHGREKIGPDKLTIGDLIAVRFVVEKDGTSTIVRMKDYGPVQPAESGESVPAAAQP